MDKVIVIKNNNGTCAIVHPASAMFDATSRDRLELAANERLAIDADENAIWDFIISRSSLEGKTYRITDLDSLPSDRLYRNAWTDDNETETVDIHIGRAQDIHKDKMRAIRKPLLESLDVSYMKALEQGDDTAKAAIVAQKQTLRDVTKLELPADIESLKTFMPDCLK